MEFQKWLLKKGLSTQIIFDDNLKVWWQDATLFVYFDFL
jgi:hypothetical protein